MRMISPFYDRFRLHRERSGVIPLAFAVMLLCALPAFAQGPVPNGGGVYVDTDGVLQARSLESDARENRLQGRAFDRLIESGDLICVSLPKAFEAAREAFEAGDAVPDQARFLGGMVQVKYLFVDTASGDLVLVGIGDEIDTSDAHRPVGATTGRPLLQLDDLVVALRTVGPGARRSTYGCTIDMPEGAQQRFVDALGRAQRDRVGQGEKMSRMAEAVGPQTVGFWGVEADSRFAFVLLEADVRMKRLALGIDDAPVRGVGSAVTGRAQRYTRCWFRPSYDPIVVSEDGNTFAFAGPRLELHASNSRDRDDAEASPEAARFARQANGHMGELCGAIPAWADLANLVDLSVVAALIREDRLDERIDWDIAWVLDPRDGYPVAEVEVPELVETLVVSMSRGYAAGGVVIELDETVDSARREVAGDDATLPEGLSLQGDGVVSRRVVAD